MFFKEVKGIHEEASNKWLNGLDIQNVILVTAMAQKKERQLFLYFCFLPVMHQHFP
jgi:hypothetical protein